MPWQRFCHVRRYLRNIAFLIIGFSLCLGFFPGSVQPQSGTMSSLAYQLLSQRVAANQTNFYVYLDQDAGLNHDFPSGFFASLGNRGTIHPDTGCIDAPHGTTGCSTNPDVLDRVHATVMRISFDLQTPGNFVGVNIEEPKNWGVLQTGKGYDLRGATYHGRDTRDRHSGTQPQQDAFSGLFPPKDRLTLLQPGTHTFTCIGTATGAFDQCIEVGVGNLLTE